MVSGNLPGPYPRLVTGPAFLGVVAETSFSDRLLAVNEPGTTSQGFSSRPHKKASETITDSLETSGRIGDRSKERGLMKKKHTEITELRHRITEVKLSGWAQKSSEEDRTRGRRGSRLKEGDAVRAAPASRGRGETSCSSGGALPHCFPCPALPVGLSALKCQNHERASSACSGPFVKLGTRA